MAKTLNPFNVSFSILVISLILSISIFKLTISRWMAFVMILTFSSGIITLFLYTSSTASNETSKTKKRWIFIRILIITAISTNQPKKKETLTIKLFSSQSFIITIGIILIMTIVFVSNQSHHPNQSIFSSF